jgi:CubicO group peptidase (beta-lactamase class C family)
MRGGLRLQKTERPLDFSWFGGLRRVIFKPPPWLEQRVLSNQPRMIVAVLALLAPIALAAADWTQDRIVGELMATAGIPGMEAAVVTTDHIVWEKSFGDAVRNVPGPRKAMQRGTLLQSASMGKLLVTVAALQLVEKGLIKLDDDIDASLPVVVRNPAWPDVPITWRMLLTHTSSLADDESDALASKPPNLLQLRRALAELTAHGVEAGPFDV